MAKGDRPQWEVMREIEEIQKQQRQDRLEAMKMKMDKRAEFRVLDRRLQTERMETELETQFKKECEENVAAAKRDHEEKLAAEMSRLGREELREQKIREQMRDSSEELKSLESKLRAAYVSKQLTAQIAEKEAVVAEEKLEKIKVQEIIECEKKCMEEQMRQLEEVKLNEKFKYRAELQDQIKNNSKKQQEANKSLLIDKCMLDNMIWLLREEEKKEKEARIEHLKKTKQDIKEFRCQQEIFKKMEKEAKEEEDRRIKAYFEQRESEEKKKIEESKEKEAIKNKIREQIELSFLSQQDAKREREEILAVIAEDDFRQRELKREHEEMEVAINLRKELQKIYDIQVDETNKMRMDDYEEQELYRKQILTQLAKDAEHENQLSGVDSLKKKELREHLQRQIEEKHRLKVEDWQRQAALDKLQEIEEENRMKIVEEERLCILRKHAANLVGYLPRGVLREDDLMCLGPDFLEKFCKFKAMNNS